MGSISKVSRIVIVVGVLMVGGVGAAETASLHVVGGPLVPIGSRAGTYELGAHAELAGTFPLAPVERLAVRGEVGGLRVPGVTGVALLSANVGLGIEYLLFSAGAWSVSAEASATVHYGSVSVDPAVTGFGYGFDAGLVGRWRADESWTLQIGAEYTGYPQLLDGIQIFAGTAFALPSRERAPRIEERPTRFRTSDEDAPSVDDESFDVTVTLDGIPFTPDGDGVNDTLTFGVTTTAEEVERWTLAVYDRNDRLFYEREGSSLPSAITWDGSGSAGQSVLSADRYSYRFAVESGAGDTASASGSIPIGILVREEADASRISIASISFRGNSAELELDPDSELGASNRDVLAQLAEALERFETYSVRVIGHAVNLTGTREEERDILAPLSLARAQNVRRELVARGVDGDRIVAEGRGGLEPVVPHEDLDERWQNRRVELILVRDEP